MELPDPEGVMPPAKRRALAVQGLRRAASRQEARSF
jgi:hypothetical protein